MTGPERSPGQGPGRIWSSRGIPRWGWWAMMVLPSLFILVGAVMLIDTVTFAGRAERATGTVVSVERVVSTIGSSRAPSHSYRPTIRYADASGQQHEAVTYVSTSHYGFAPGEKVEILYDPAAPEEVRIASPFSLWGLPFLLMGLGGLFLGMVRFVRRRVARSQSGSPAW